MALPIAHPLDEVVVHGSSVDASTGKAGVIRAPFKGTIKQVGTMVGSVLSTADSTCTVSIAGTAITGGAFTLLTASSAIGDHRYASLDSTGNATITAANTCLENDTIKFAFTGSGTAGGPVYVYAVIRRG